MGLVLSRSAALPLAQLACFKAGATFVPCDPSWPKARIAEIMAESMVSAVVCDVGCSGELLGEHRPGAVIEVDGRCVIDDCVFLGIDREAFAAEAEARPQTRPPPPSPK